MGAALNAKALNSRSLDPATLTSNAGAFAAALITRTRTRALPLSGMTSSLTIRSTWRAESSDVA